jgi:hypothetical protein
MKPEIRTLTVMLVLITFCPPAVAGERDLVAALVPGDIKGARINLNPWGPHLGFESEIDGDDPRMVALVSVIRNAEPAQGHKCANRGTIRFLMSDGGVIAVGLLPSHSEGFYDFRLYNGDSLESVYRVHREPLFTALTELGVPLDDPAFYD